MASLFQNIRGALQNKLESVSGIPNASNRAWDGIEFTPTPGTAFVEATLIPTSSRRATMGPNGFWLHEGLFQVAVVYPSGEGTGSAEAVADAIKTAFDPDVDMDLGGETVRVRHSERGAVAPDGAWIRVPVTVAWYCHSQNNG